STDAVRLEEDSTAQSSGPLVEAEEDVDDEPTPALFINYYICENCDHTWSDIWSAMCDDDCPHCGSRHMSPFKSEEVAEEEHDADGGGLRLAASESGRRRRPLPDGLPTSAQIHAILPASQPCPGRGRHGQS